ncbi:MAG: hypothetical protein B6241_09460 [Spirochaetaceae bacterium 4572_59]|nr:MAG: hypothetical protein B6241_09460 [Spirochaetaceae bacterium 4572_59]
MITATAPLIGMIAALAARAMRDEVELTPKPGLVDRLDNGSHKDMNLSLFLMSAGVIKPFLVEMARAVSPDGGSLSVLPVLRPIGIRAEEAMFKATGGINTHKGQIFSLGVCTAAAMRVGNSAAAVLEEAGRICSGICGELKGAGSNGQKAFLLYGSRGIRGEAEESFPSVRNNSLPRYRHAEKNGLSPEEAALESLIYLMTEVEDSNVLYRRGREGLSLMREKAEGFILSGGMMQEQAYAKLGEMNNFFIQENISPGGCADLLALTLFLAELEDSLGR